MRVHVIPSAKVRVPAWIGFSAASPCQANDPPEPKQGLQDQKIIGFEDLRIKCAVHVMTRSAIAALRRVVNCPWNRIFVMRSFKRVQPIFLLFIITILSSCGDNQDALFKAVMKDDISEVTHLARQGINLDANNKDGLTPLIIAALRKNERMVALLISFKANVNASDPRGFTPLMAAAYSDSPDIVWLLLTHGADPKTRMKGGVTAGDIALIEEHPAVTAAFIVWEARSNGNPSESGIDHNQRREEAPTAWSELVKSGEKLKASSSLVPTFDRLFLLADRSPSQVTAFDVIRAGSPSSELSGAFVNWWDAKDGRNPNQSVGEGLAQAIRNSNEKTDLPFLIYLEFHREVNRRSAGDASRATREQILRRLEADREDVLGLLLHAIERQTAPETMKLLCDMIASLPDHRSIPTLVSWYRDHDGFPTASVVDALHRIDPDRKILDPYFSRLQELTGQSRESPDQRAAVRLKGALGALRAQEASPPAGSRQERSSYAGGEFAIQLQAPRGWQVSSSPLPEMKNATLTLERVGRRSEAGWVAFAVNRPPRPDGSFIWVAFHGERIRPYFEDFSGGPPGTWTSGNRTYWQIAWRLKRSHEGIPLRAQTSVIWDTERDIRFEILQVVPDDGRLFAFDPVRFAFDARVFQGQVELFPR